MAARLRLRGMSPHHPGIAWGIASLSWQPPGVLAEKVDDPGSRDGTRPEKWFGSLPVAVRRNAYGRQLGSFRTVGMFDGKPDVPMTFIRAPAITAVSSAVEVLSTFDGLPTAVRWRNVTAFTWHPELNMTMSAA